MQTLSANVMLQTCDTYFKSNFIYNPRKPEKSCFPEIAAKDRVQAEHIFHGKLCNMQLMAQHNGNTIKNTFF